MARSPVSKIIIVRNILLMLLVAGAVFFGPTLSHFARSFYVNIRAVHSDAYEGYSTDALKNELVQRDAELQRVRYQAILYNMLVSENLALRNVTGAGQISEGIITRVLSRPPQSNYDTLIVDKGLEDGVKEDDLAIFQDFALGRVVAVDQNSASIQLFSSPGIQKDALAGTPHAVVVVTGQGGGAFEFSVPQGVTVLKGDVVRLPSPSSLGFAIVMNTTVNARDTSVIVRAAQPFSFSELDFIRLVHR